MPTSLSPISLNSEVMGTSRILAIQNFLEIMKPKKFEIWVLGLLNPLETNPTVHECVLSHFSHVGLFATLGTLARQAPLSMGFSRHDTGVGCHTLLQGIFLTRDGTRVSYISCIGKQVLYHWHHLGSSSQL